jgi:hypothetical protein
MGLQVLNVDLNPMDGEKISEKERFQPGNIPNSQVHYKLDLLFKFVSRLSINREIFGET